MKSQKHCVLRVYFMFYHKKYTNTLFQEIDKYCFFSNLHHSTVYIHLYSNLKCKNPKILGVQISIFSQPCQLFFYCVVHSQTLYEMYISLYPPPHFSCSFPLYHTYSLFFRPACFFEYCNC